MTGARILVVEDVMLLAEALCDELLEGGFEPVGPAASVDVALRLIETSRIDTAILDIRLLHEMSFPVAYALRERGVPFMFLTAYQRRNLPVDLSDSPLIEKPFHPPMLLETVHRLLRKEPTV